MRLTVREVAARVDGRIVGSGAVEITGFSGIDHAGPGDLTFVGHEKYAGLAPSTRAAAVMVAKEIAGCAAVQIVVRDASVAFAVVMAGIWRDRLRGTGGRHPSAVVDATARIADDVALGACVVVEAGASIGARTVIGAGTVVAAEVVIGADCLIHPNVTILHGSRIHDRVIIHSGAVLGADGFGYATDHAGHHHKIPQTGIVVVEDDVEIGANTTVDRARFRETRIGRGTKIDNLVQIAHNVVIGHDAIIVAQTGIAGSTEVGERVVLGAMVGVGGHLRLGAGAQVAAMSGVNRSLDANQAYIGAPLMTYREGMRSRVIQRRLPELDKSLKDALARIAALEALIARLPKAAESP